MSPVSQPLLDVIFVDGLAADHLGSSPGREGEDGVSPLDPATPLIRERLVPGLREGRAAEYNHYSPVL